MIAPPRGTVLVEKYEVPRSLNCDRPAMSYVRGYVVFRCLAALSAAHVLDDLAAGHSVDLEKSARTRRLNRDVLQAVTRYLYGAGVLTRNAAGAYVTAVEITDEERASIEVFRAYDAMFNSLPDLLLNVKTYGPALARAEELDAKGTARMCRCTAYSAVIDVAASQSPRCVLDLGCGAGELLIELCKRQACLRGYGIDVSAPTIRYAQKRVREERLAHRLHVTVGDIFALSGGNRFTQMGHGQIDLLVATSVFHEFAYRGVKRLITALRTVRAAFPGVALVLYEAMEQSDDVLRAAGSAALEHHLFHRLSLQGIASESTWVPAFSRAGYYLAQNIDVPPGGRLFVLEDRRPNHSIRVAS